MAYTIERLRTFGDTVVRVRTAHGTFEGTFDVAALAPDAVTVLLEQHPGDAPRDSLVLLLDDIEEVKAQ